MNSQTPEQSGSYLLSLPSGRTKPCVHHTNKTDRRPPEFTPANLQTSFWLSLSLNVQKEDSLKSGRMREARRGGWGGGKAAVSPGQSKGLLWAQLRRAIALASWLAPSYCRGLVQILPSLLSPFIPGASRSVRRKSSCCVKKAESQREDSTEQRAFEGILKISLSTGEAQHHSLWSFSTPQSSLWHR